MNIRIIRRLALMLVITLLTVFSFAADAASTVPATQTESAYSEVTLGKGIIIKNVIATGSLRFEEEENLKLPEALTLDSIEVKAGEAVTKGQILARYDTAALKEGLKEAKAALTTQNEIIVQLLAQQSSGKTIKTAIAGIVKQLNLEAGQMVQQILKGQPAAILSTNGLMQVSFTPSQAFSLGQAVRVKTGTQTQTGSVARLETDGSALITFPDTRAKIDEVVEVTLNGVTVGEGKAQVNLPYLLYTQVDGVVESVSVKVNSTAARNASIFLIENAAPAEDYLEALEDREEMVQSIRCLEELLANPEFKSEMDGIVAAVTAQEGTALQKGSELLRLYSTSAFALDVAVDELDILSLQAGQEGFASLDALTDTLLPVKVERISLLGNSTSGITSYTVTLSVQQDNRLRSGMNGTATLMVGEARDSVLVPLAALMSDRSGNYVLLKGETAGSEAQGIKTYVEVGLSDTNYVAVSEGLKEGDIVLVRTSALTGTQQTQQMLPNFNNMMNPNRQFNPGGGQRP